MGVLVIKILIKTTSIVILSTSLQGCFTAADYVRGGPYGGQAWDAEWAQSHCSKYNKAAVITAIDPDKGWGKNRYTFNCVTPSR